MRRFTIIGIAAAAALTAAAAVAPAHAARPVRQGCVGQTFSQAAHEPGALGRDVIRNFAREGGLGVGVQDLQAGVLPDEVAANTCND